MARELNEALSVVSLIASCVHLKVLSMCCPGYIHIHIHGPVRLYASRLPSRPLSCRWADHGNNVSSSADLHKECSNRETCLVVEFRLCRLYQGNAPSAPRPWPGLSSQSSISHSVHTFRTPYAMLFEIACRSRSKLDERLNSGDSTVTCDNRGR
jgi:hypothetical protein